MRSVILSCVLMSAVLAVDLPSAWKRCPVSPENDNKPDDCLKDAALDAIVKLEQGNQQLGVDSLDPLKVKVVKIDQGESSPVAIKLTFKDCDLYGIKNLKLDTLSGKTSSPEGFLLKASGHTSQLSLVGFYNIAGRVLVLPIQGHGHSNLTLDDVKADFTVKGEQQMKDGVRYLKVTHVKLNIKSTSRLWIYLENLFNGDKALGDTMNVFLNNNWQDIFKELRHAINTAFGSVIEQYTKQILESVPYDSIFITS